MQHHMFSVRTSERRLLSFAKPDMPQVKSEKVNIPEGKEKSKAVPGVTAMENSKDRIKKADDAGQRGKKSLSKLDDLTAAIKKSGSGDVKKEKDVAQPNSKNTTAIPTPTDSPDRVEPANPSTAPDSYDSSDAGSSRIGANLNIATAVAGARAENNNQNNININVNPPQRAQDQVKEGMSEEQDFALLRTLQDQFRVAASLWNGTPSKQTFVLQQMNVMNKELEAKGSSWRLEDNRNPKNPQIFPYQIKERMSLASLSVAQRNYINARYLVFKSGASQRDMIGTVEKVNGELVKKGITDRHFVLEPGFSLPFMRLGLFIPNATPQPKIPDASKDTRNIAQK